MEWTRACKRLQTQLVLYFEVSGWVSREMLALLHKCGGSAFGGSRLALRWTSPCAQLNIVVRNTPHAAISELAEYTDTPVYVALAHRI